MIIRIATVITYFVLVIPFKSLYDRAMKPYSLLCLVLSASLLIACDYNVPGKPICTETDSGEALDCTISEINAAVGCQLFSNPVMNYVTNDATGQKTPFYVIYNQASGANIAIEFLPKLSFTNEIGAAGVETSDYQIVNGVNTEISGIQIELQKDGYGATIAHELGHSLLLTYSDNPSDNVHSSDPNSVMYAYVTPLTDYNMSMFGKDIVKQGKACNP